MPCNRSCIAMIMLCMCLARAYKPWLSCMYRRANSQLYVQGSLPSRMSREGAARTYHMYTYWGYFNRRMAARRQLEQKTMPGLQASTGIAFGDNSKQQKSYYGKMTNVWRYFENVPDAISDLRTKEAAHVADRHLRCALLSACNINTLPQESNQANITGLI